MSFRQDLYKQLELVEGRKRKVEEKLAEIEDQQVTLKQMVETKEKKIVQLQSENDQLRQMATSEITMQAKNLESMSEVEAELKMKTLECDELQKEFDFTVKQKNAQIKDL